jgi:hypothetical protein
VRHLHFIVVVVDFVVVVVLGAGGGRLDHLGGGGSHLELGPGSAGDGGVEVEVVVVAGEVIDDLLDG